MQNCSQSFDSYNDCYFDYLSDYIQNGSLKCQMMTDPYYGAHIRVAVIVVLLLVWCLHIFMLILFKLLSIVNFLVVVSLLRPKELSSITELCILVKPYIVVILKTAIFAVHQNDIWKHMNWSILERIPSYVHMKDVHTSVNRRHYLHNTFEIIQ